MTINIQLTDEHIASLQNGDVVRVLGHNGLETYRINLGTREAILNDDAERIVIRQEGVN